MQAALRASNGRRLLVKSPPATTQVIKVVWIEAKLKTSSYGWTYPLSKKRAITHAALTSAYTRLGLCFMLVQVGAW